MEDFLKSKEAMEEWKNFIGNANVDVLDVLKNATKVAASDHPYEFRTMRDKIAEMLFSRELINYCGGAILDKSKIIGETKNSHVELPLMEKQDKETSKPQRSVTVSIKLKHVKVKSAKDNASKGPLNPKQKVADKSYGDEYEFVVCDSVNKLQHVGVAINSDHHTMGIGKTLQKRASRDAMDEWLNKKSSVVKPISMQDKPKSLDMERKINSGKTIVLNVPRAPRVTPDQQSKSRIISKVAANNQKGLRVAPDQQFKSPMNTKEARNTKSGPTNTSFQEKLEAIKRKFQQHYMEEENLKKKRIIQVVELHEVIKKGRIPPKDQQVRHVNKQFRR
nr:transcription elongation factor, TFIIS/CRSP70 [Tanacetum cinerariifolium]